jgi:hypothetical protein
MLPCPTIPATARTGPTGAAARHHGQDQFATRTPGTAFPLLPVFLAGAGSLRAGGRVLGCRKPSRSDARRADWTRCPQAGRWQAGEDVVSAQRSSVLRMIHVNLRLLSGADAPAPGGRPPAHSAVAGASGALAVSRRTEARPAGRSEVVKTARRYRTVQIQAGPAPRHRGRPPPRRPPPSPRRHQQRHLRCVLIWPNSGRPRLDRFVAEIRQMG